MEGYTFKIDGEEVGYWDFFLSIIAKFEVMGVTKSDRLTLVAELDEVGRLDLDGVIYTASVDPVIEEVEGSK